MLENVTKESCRITRKIYQLCAGIILLVCLTGIEQGVAQHSATPPNVYSPLISGTYNVDFDVSSSLGWSSENNVIGDIGNYASSPALSVGTTWIEVEDESATGSELHPAGSYAGFVVNDNLLTLFGDVEITIYNDDASTSESFSGGNLLGLSLSGARAKIGFIAPIDFNRIRITFSGVALGSNRVYYAEILSPDDTASPDLLESCNMALPWTQGTVDGLEDGFPVVIEPANTGGSGISLGDISGLENVVNNDIDDFASMYSILDGLGGSLDLSVRTLGEVVPEGTFAGFNVSTDELLSVGILDEIIITTYLDGTAQETVLGNNLIASVGLLGSSDRYTIGFQTASDFDEIQITLDDGLLSLDLSVFNVYHAVITNFCEGEALMCQTDTPMSTPDYPVFINAENTGTSGVVSACVLGDCITGVDNVINGNPNEGAVITPLATSGSASISVKFGAGTFASGTNPVFVGFDIENSALLDVDVIDGIEITTYLDGTEQESSEDASATLVEVNTDILTGNGRRTIGFAASSEFDEVQLNINNVLGVELGATTVYQLILRELCAGPFVPCGESAHLEQDTYPVIINSERTGFDGAACVGCSIENADALISADDTDYTTITSTVGVLNGASISVLNPVDTYPANTTAGFVIDTRESNLVELDLFNALEVCTYNNGTQQECRSGSSLISLTLLIPLLSPDDGVFNVGFVTSQPYDEIVLRTGDLVDANVLDGEMHVYSSFVDFHSVDSDGNACPDIEITLTGSSCYRTLSSPVTGLTYSSMLGDLWTQGATGSDHPEGDSNIFTWPLTETGNSDEGWVPLVNMADEIPTGTGFLMSVFEDDEFETPGDFPKTITIAPGPQPAAFTMSGADMNQNPDGWTLLGNPFQFNIDVTQLTTNDLTGSFYVYDRNAGGPTNGASGGWISRDSEGFGDLVDGAIAVGQGFFVQTVASGSPSPSIEFSGDARTEDGQFYGKENERKDYVRLELQGEELYNSAWIRFSDQGSNDQVYGDAVQLYPFEEQYAVLASQKSDDGLLDIGHYKLPDPYETIEIPLHADVTKPGTFTITATELDIAPNMTLFLKDTHTGEVSEITDQFEYTFTVSQAGKQIVPGGQFVCSDSPMQSKAATSEPRFIITNEINTDNSEDPVTFKLNQNYPNPFNPTTVISYELPQSSDVRLEVFDLNGRLVATLANGMKEAGAHTVTFDASNLSSGVYVYKLQAGSTVFNRKLTLIK